MSASRHVAALELDARTRDARDVEQVIDQAREVIDLAFDYVDGGLGAFVGLRRALEKFRCSADGSQRIAQLVRQHGEELVLLAIGILQLQARAHLRRDVAEVTDHAKPAFRQRNAAGLPFIGLDALAIGAFFDPLGHEVRFTRGQRALEDGDDLVRVLPLPEPAHQHAEICADQLRAVAEYRPRGRIHLADAQRGIE